MIILISMYWFLQGVLLLLFLAGVIGLIKVSLDVIRFNVDESISIWFKARQSSEHIKDRVFERQLLEDKAEVVLNTVRQDTRLKEGLNNFVIAGLEAGKEVER